MKPPSEYLKTFDWILIGGGGLVFERIGIWVNIDKWTKQSRAKIGVIGLGINKVNNELSQELFSLIDVCEFFYVRDEESKKLINNHPKVEVYPDLTWCVPFSKEEKSTKTKENLIALNLCPCHWKNFEPDNWYETIKKIPNFSIVPYPLNYNVNKDFDLMNQYFATMPSEFSLDLLVKSKIMVACRYHALIFAMQLEKPFIAINYDYKISRLLNESNLGELLLETNEYKKLPEKIDFILENENLIRNKIKSFAVSQTQKALLLKQNIINHIQHTPVNQSSNFTYIKTFIKQYLR